MATVLCDGQPSSVRALELALVPNFLLKHETEQLVLLHGWPFGRFSIPGFQSFSLAVPNTPELPAVKEGRPVYVVY